MSDNYIRPHPFLKKTPDYTETYYDYNYVESTLYAAPTDGLPRFTTRYERTATDECLYALTRTRRYHEEASYPDLPIVPNHAREPPTVI